jgi:VanZ family protein
MVKKHIFSFLVALIILYLSLTSSHTFDSVPMFDVPYFDKFVHFSMYFGLMAVIIFENRRSVKGAAKLFLISLIPLSYGIILEILQALLTNTRSGNIYDALADEAGILTAVLIGSIYLKKIKSSIY